MQLSNAAKIAKAITLHEMTPNCWTAGLIYSKTEAVRVTRVCYTKRGFAGKRIDYVIKVGKPNYDERERLKKAETVPVYYTKVKKR